MLLRSTHLFVRCQGLTPTATTSKHTVHFGPFFFFVVSTGFSAALPPVKVKVKIKTVSQRESSLK